MQHQTACPGGGNIDRVICYAEATVVITPVIEAIEADAFLTDDDREHIKKLANAKRRNEQASWRAALRRTAGCAPVYYTGTGAPRLRDSGFSIGVSHTRSQAALIVSSRRCAIDIEESRRNFMRAASRYISQDEYSLPFSDDERFYAVMWCAKETLYKFSGRKGTGLLEDLRIVSADPGPGILTGAIRNTHGKWDEYTMHVLPAGETTCVWMAPDTVK